MIMQNIHTNTQYTSHYIRLKISRAELTQKNTGSSSMSVKTVKKDDSGTYKFS